VAAVAGPLRYASEDEARAYLQTRLQLLSRLMFGSFIALLLGMLLLYWAYPLLEPTHNRYIYIISLAGLALLVVIWRGFLARKPLGTPALHRIDAFYAISTGLIFSSAAVIAYDRTFAETANL
jgi:hypothetical protein